MGQVEAGLRLTSGNARGGLFLNAITFVREHHGVGAHEAVVRALPAALAGPFLSPPGEAAWRPLAALAAYMETAQGQLAPGDEDFWRRMGRFGGAHDLRARAVAWMLQTIEIAARMAPIAWRAYYDVGRLEIAERDAGGASVRVFDFAPRRSLCVRIHGALEGQMAGRVRLREALCAARGDARCEWRAEWGC
jgi:hypothetical protein